MGVQGGAVKGLLGILCIFFSCNLSIIIFQCHSYFVFISSLNSCLRDSRGGGGGLTPLLVVLPLHTHFWRLVTWIFFYLQGTVVRSIFCNFFHPKRLNGRCKKDFIFIHAFEKLLKIDLKTCVTSYY